MGRSVRTRSTWVLLGTTGLVAVLLVANSSDDNPTSKWRVFADGYEGGSDEAEVDGVVRYSESDRCFRFELSGERVYAVVWPPGTEGLGGDRPGVDVPGVGEIFAGDVIRGGGGYHTLGPGDEPPPGTPPDIRDCVAPGEEFVSVDTLTVER